MVDNDPFRSDYTTADTVGHVAWTNRASDRLNRLTPLLANKPTVIGSRSGNDALASLISQLANLGLITDGTTATTSGVAPSPAAVLNIGSGAGQNHFKVQVAPTGASSYVEYTQDDIQNGYAESPYFYVTSDNWVHFQSRVDGPTTSGSSFARSELREMDLDGTTNMAFNARTNTHRILGTSRITHQMANKPEIVIAQMHDGNRDRIAIRTQAISSANPTVTALSIRINGSIGDKSGTGGNGWQESSAYVLNRVVSWKIEGVNDVWKVYIDDMTTPKVTVPAAGLSSTSTAWYFKAGAYLQSSTSDDAGSEYGAVELHRLQHWHTGWPTNQAIPSL